MELDFEFDERCYSRNRNNLENMVIGRIMSHIGHYCNTAILTGLIMH